MILTSTDGTPFPSIPTVAENCEPARRVTCVESVSQSDVYYKPQVLGTNLLLQGQGVNDCINVDRRHL